MFSRWRAKPRIPTNPPNRRFALQPRTGRDRPYGTFQPDRERRAFTQLPSWTVSRFRSVPVSRLPFCDQSYSIRAFDSPRGAACFPGHRLLLHAYWRRGHDRECRSVAGARDDTAVRKRQWTARTSTPFGHPLTLALRGWRVAERSRFCFVWDRDAFMFRHRLCSSWVSFEASSVGTHRNQRVKGLCFLIEAVTVAVWASWSWSNSSKHCLLENGKRYSWRSSRWIKNLRLRGWQSGWSGPTSRRAPNEYLVIVCCRI